jgi:hypothetical protein
MKYKKIITCGCSFSDPSTPFTWVNLLERNLKRINSELVFDHRGLSSQGNQLIQKKTVHAIHKALSEGYKPEEICVFVMWSGHDREDEIFSFDAIDNNANFVYQFTDKVCHVSTGGTTREGDGNSRWFGYRDIHKFKSLESRAVENAIWKIGLKRYLDALGYQSIFVNFLDPTFPNRSDNFDIVKFLPDPINTTYSEETK